MYEKLKEYGLYIILGLIAMGALGYMLFNTQKGQRGSELEEIVVDTTLRTLSQNEKVLSSKTISSSILPEIDKKDIGNKKINGNKMLLVTSETFDDIIENGNKMTGDVSSQLKEGLTDGQLKFIQIGGSKIKISEDANLKGIELSKDNEVIAGSKIIDKNNLKQVDHELRGFGGSAFGFGPYTKSEAKEVVNSYFTNGVPVQVGDTDDYVVLIQHDFTGSSNKNINKTVSFRSIPSSNGGTSSTTSGGDSSNTTTGNQGTSNSNTTGGTSSSSSNQGTNSSTDTTNGGTTVQPQPVVRKNIPGTLDGYTIKNHVGEELNSQDKTQENVDLEKVVQNGKQSYTGVIKLMGNILVLENVSLPSLICNQGFENQNGQCVQHCIPLVQQPNGVVKANKCAVSGQTYELNGEQWYVAGSSNDIKNKIFNENFRSNRIVTTKVSNMSYLFGNKSGFNEDISTWDTSNVADMSNMFNFASSFNQSVSNFDTSNVTDMRGMFGSASSFNQSVSNFDTSNVTNISYMFYGASSFNQSVSNFDTSNVTNISYMFRFATSFNQSINHFDLGNIVSIREVLYGTNSLSKNNTKGLCKYEKFKNDTRNYSRFCS